MREPVEMDQLVAAGYEFTRQIERLASVAASKDDVHAVYRLMSKAITVQRMVGQIERFESHLIK